MKSLLKKLRYVYCKDYRRLISVIHTITGFRPSNLDLYRLAVTHHSKARNVRGFVESNERLEFLGDAILGAIITDYLFSKYPHEDEGFLTEIRSRIVNREALNTLGQKIGIKNILQYDKKNTPISSNMLGDTLEAMVGAVYLDKGYLLCKKFVIKKLIQPYLDLHLMINSTVNYKSKVIEWAQQNKMMIHFEVDEITNDSSHNEFIARVLIGDDSYEQGMGYTKKKATQNASQKACIALGLE